MPAGRFDLVIIGDSLAARMAAALLARHGKRLLLLGEAGVRDPWQHSSLFLEKLLAALGARNSLTPAQPFQVLSSRARVTVSPDLPFTDELAREFGELAPAVAGLLDRFERTGHLLEELLWENGGLPGPGWKSAAAWRWLCTRRKLPFSVLTTPLSAWQDSIPDPAGEWLRDLFQGLALQPLARLTVADGALLWANARRAAAVSGASLEELLQKRIEQFHGTRDELAALQSIEHAGGMWKGVLQGKGHFQAKELLLGDLADHLPNGGGFPVPARLGEPSVHLVTTQLGDAVSPLLEQQVIVGGPAPLRLTFTPGDGGPVALAGCGGRPAEAQLRQQLEPVLPFARYALERPTPEADAKPSAAVGTDLPKLLKLALNGGKHLWFADDRLLLPQLGSGGAALLAWTLTGRIDPAAFPKGN